MKTRYSISSAFLVIMGLIVSCTPDESELATFKPEADSPFKIAFSYPKHWVWESPPDPMTKTFGVKYTHDPYPTCGPDIGFCGKISIMVVVDSHPKLSMEESIDRYFQEPKPFQVLNERPLQIDNHNAKWLTIKRPPNLAAAEAYVDTTLIEEHIFLYGDTRYYDLLIIISENEVGGQFHTEFLDLVESIKFLP